MSRVLILGMWKLLSMFVAVLLFWAIPVAYSDVWIPDDEFAGFFDSSGIYTVVGAVKNTESFAVIPTLSILLDDGGSAVAVSQTLPTVLPGKDIPFRIPIHQIGSSDVVLQKPEVAFQRDDAKSHSNVQVIYDRTLIKHPDGHLTGKIVNSGNDTEYDIKVYALIHGANHKLIDVGKNVEKINKIEPGQMIDFTMYPDPLVASEVTYYSCFAIGDETIVPLYAVRNNQRFDFRYDSTASFSVMGFDRTGTALSIHGINSFKLPTYVNFEFPRTSDHEKFEVSVNGKPVKFLQSMDEDGSWHVVFDIDGPSQNDIVIKGFASPSQNSADIGGVDVLTGQSLEGERVAYLALLGVLIAGAVGGALYFLKQKKAKATV